MAKNKALERLLVSIRIRSATLKTQPLLGGLVPRLRVMGTFTKPVSFLFIAVVISSVLSPHFLTWDNIMAVLVASSPLMIIAIGEALVVLTGMIDLGTESVLASSGMLLALLDLYTSLPTYVSVLLTLIYGAAVGLANGVLVTKAKIPSFISTLGMYWGLRGIGMVISNGWPLGPSSVSPPKQFTFTGIAGRFFGFPLMVAISLVMVVVFQVFVSEFKKGREIYAVGGNEVAAKNCGVNVDRTKLFVFVVSGTLGAVSGIIMTAWLNQGYAWTAQGYSLEAIAAVVLGGIPFTGGTGTIAGVAVGSFIISMLADVIVLIGISPLYNYIVVAIVLVLAGLQLQRRYVSK